MDPYCDASRSTLHYAADKGYILLLQHNYRKPHFSWASLSVISLLSGSARQEVTGLWVVLVKVLTEWLRVTLLGWRPGPFVLERCLAGGVAVIIPLSSALLVVAGLFPLPLQQIADCQFLVE